MKTRAAKPTYTTGFYDALYSQKDYAAETNKIVELVQVFKESSGKQLLDVACGTGGHLEYLRTSFDVSGLDLNPVMLNFARQKLPDVPFHQADMVNFDLAEQFDVITCLFSAIGYVGTIPRLHQTLITLKKHLAPGGVIMLEPWITQENYQTGRVHATFVDEPDLKIARMNISEREGNLAVMNMHYLLATPDGVEHFVERHELALFAESDYLQAFERADLKVTCNPEGLIGRGLYIGVHPTAD